MKFKKNRKLILCILGIIILSFTYYEGVYVKLGYKVEQVKNEESKIKTEYDNAVNSINSIDDRKDEKNLLCNKVADKTSIYYPTISQEHLILELNQLLNESGLIGEYKFNPIEVKSVEKVEMNNEDLENSSLESITNEYKSIDENDYEDNSQNSNLQDDSNNSVQESQNENTVEQLKCELSFSGQYENLDEFLNLLKENEKKIVATNINVSQKTLDEIKGNMDIEFYAVPKIDDEITDYLEWDFEEEYGKDNPFNGEIVENNDYEKDYSDFNIDVRSSTSVLPTVVIGKSDDDFKNTYVYANNNSEEECEMILTKKDDKYYYKYKTSKEAFPNNYDTLGNEFIPSTENIVINISSEGRVEDEDNSSLKLKVVNNTDLLTQVNIKNDDDENPRVTIMGDGKNISVIAK